MRSPAERVVMAIAVPKAMLPVTIDVAGRGEGEGKDTVAGAAGGSVSALVIASVLS